MNTNEYKVANQPTKKLESLEVYRDGLFELRFSGYTYKSICDWLISNNIEVSEHTVRRFFVKHCDDYVEYTEGMK